MSIFYFLSFIFYILFSIFLLLYIVLEILSSLGTMYLSDAPYVASKNNRIIQALKLAQVNKNDVLYDLGSGDGRVLLIALKQFNVKKAVGYELDKFQVLKTLLKLKYNLFNSLRYNVFNKSIYTATIDDASVLFLYMYPKVITKLKPLILKKPGLKVVSCLFEIPFLKLVDSKNVDGQMLYYYIV